MDHEKLDVYQLELQFVAGSTELMVKLVASTEAKTRRITETCDHLERAGLSSLFNTAEGNGKRPMKTRAKFFRRRTRLGHGVRGVSRRAGCQRRM
jgi:hypothetical protein